MTDITKKVNRLVPPTERTQVFTEADASAGDVLLVTESLGHAAKKVLIETTANLSLRFNVYHKVYPQRDGRDLAHTSHLSNLALGGTIKDDTGAIVSLEADETFEMDGSYPTSDIELVTVSGNFTITVV